MGEEDHAHGAQDDEAARVAAVYSEYAADPRKREAWSATNPGNRAMRAEVADALWAALPADGLILDAGCGAGWWLADLRERGVPQARLAGVDIQPERIERARGVLPDADLQAADVRSLPHGDASVAFVALLTVLSSMGDDAARIAALRECHRVLSPGGRVAIWEPRWPTGNANTARVSPALVGEVFAQARARSITLAPPLARRLGRMSRLYQPLSSVPFLRSHRLLIAQKR